MNDASDIETHHRVWLGLRRLAWNLGQAPSRMAADALIDIEQSREQWCSERGHCCSVYANTDSARGCLCECHGEARFSHSSLDGQA